MSIIAETEGKNIRTRKKGDIKTKDSASQGKATGPKGKPIIEKAARAAAVDQIYQSIKTRRAENGEAPGDEQRTAAPAEKVERAASVTSAQAVAAIQKAKRTTAAKKLWKEKCELMAVVKAEAYGHGMYEVTTYLEQIGVSSFAVATIDEGIRLRKYGISSEILILGYTSPSRAKELCKYELTQTLIDYCHRHPHHHPPADRRIRPCEARYLWHRPCGAGRGSGHFLYLQL